MLTWILRRILAIVPVLFGVTLAVFSMLFLVPGDPVKMMLAEFVTNPDQVAQMRAQLHLDEPILKQYARFVTRAGQSVPVLDPDALATRLSSLSRDIQDQAQRLSLRDSTGGAWKVDCVGYCGGATP